MKVKQLPSKSTNKMFLNQKMGKDETFDPKITIDTKKNKKTHINVNQ